MGLLPETIAPGFEMPNVWHNNPLTQGNANSILRIVSACGKKTDIGSMVEETNNNKQDASPKDTKQLVDFLAGRIDEMFQMYPFETRRDIRAHLRERLIDWVSRNARGFFGPSTSRAISACLRGQRDVVMADVERFAEFVSFLLDVPVQAGSKVVVWHGYTAETRDPACSLVMKPQGVFVSNCKN